MHIHTCPFCQRMFESAAPGTRSPCVECMDGTAFDDDSPTQRVISVVPLRDLLEPLAG
jgi:hypothetical protein